jgi:hypothetical protein
MILYHISFSYHFVSNSLLFYTHLPVQNLQNGKHQMSYIISNLNLANEAYQVPN